MNSVNILVNDGNSLSILVLVLTSLTAEYTLHTFAVRNCRCTH